MVIQHNMNALSSNRRYQINNLTKPKPPKNFLRDTASIVPGGGNTSFLWKGLEP